MKAALDTLPTDLPNAYNEILDRIRKDGEAEQLVLKILSWLFYAKRPLKMDELQEALVVELGDTRLQREYFLEGAFIVEECKGLISYDLASGIVKFAHYTVKNFLGSTKLMNHLTEIDLAKTLLTYVSFDIFKQGPYLDINYEMNPQLRLITEQYKFSDYAARFWIFYIVGKGESDAVIQDLLFDSFQSPTRIDSVCQLAFKRWPVPSGYTFLHLAARYGLTLICKALIDSRSRTSSQPYPQKRRKIRPILDIPDSNGSTPLNLAAREGHEEIVRLFVEAGANVDHADESGMTSLNWAAAEGQDGVVDILLDADANTSMMGQGSNPLHSAAFGGYISIVSALLKANVDIDAPDNQGQTALHRAVKMNQKETVKVLLNAGALVNAKDKRGRTPLRSAVRRLSVEITKMLLNAHADPNLPSDGGSTALHSLVVSWHEKRSIRRGLDLLDELLLADAKFTTQDCKGRTPLNSAILFENVGAIEALLQVWRRGVMFDDGDVEILNVLSSKPKGLCMKDVPQHLNLTDPNASSTELTPYPNYWEMMKTIMPLWNKISSSEEDNETLGSDISLSFYYNSDDSIYSIL
jgi:ankyrin repeat protein